MAATASLGLRLVVGPPNSGRSRVLLQELSEVVAQDPLVLVPGADDAERFERDLSAAGASIGVSIRSFPRLFEELLAAAGIAAAPPLSGPQRLALLRATVATAELRVLRRSARAPGFAPALAALLAELESALVDPPTLRRHAEAAGDAGAPELELAALYEGYVSLRERCGRSDDGTIAAAALAGLRAQPELWAGRPVFLHGFDELTEIQLEAIRLLAERAAVTVAVNYADQRALAARASLLGRLRDELGGETVAVLELDDSYSERASLRHLDRALFEPVAEPVPADGGVVLLEAAGERGEAEAVGGEIARLLDGGARPDEIVVALRRPALDGPIFAAVLAEMGVPAALLTEIGVGTTTVGQALRALCHAASGEPGAAEALLAHLRCDPALPAGVADWLERRLLRREAADVDGLIAGWRSPPRHLARLREATDGAGRLRALARSARELAEGVHRGAAPLAGELSHGVPLEPVELRAARAAAEVLQELAALGELEGVGAAPLTAAVEALQAATVPAWQGATDGRVRIAGPARLRGARARHLFCATMQEGVFPGPGGADPLLGEEARGRLGIPALRRRDAAEDERYLFHVCVSRPTERLYLSFKQSDDDGRPLPRSPFVDEVLDLVGDRGSEAAAVPIRSRGLADAVPQPREATTARALASALAVRGSIGAAARPAIAAIELPAATGAEVEALLEAVPDPAYRPGPLRQPQVLEDFARRELLSARSLEGWIECSYRWFVQHELTPQRLEPESDPLWLGSVVHDALHALYREAPGADAIPRPGDVGRWRARFEELLEAAVANAGSPAGTAARRLALERAKAQVASFLREEADSETALRPRPELLELGFGFEAKDDEGGESGPGPLPLGDFALRGRIDRIDLAPDGSSALVRDYKTGSKVAGLSDTRKGGGLQVQLYMLAARELLGLEPIGGLYQPLGAHGDRRARGIVVKGDERLAGVPLSMAGDGLDAEAFEAELEAARELAIDRGGAMRTGAITRDPRGGRCPRWCTYQPICRLERAAGGEENEGSA